MKAIRLHELGGPEVLRYEDTPVPQPLPGEVLVRVHAAGINPPDWYVRDGLTSGSCDHSRCCRAHLSNESEGPPLPAG